MLLPTSPALDTDVPEPPFGTMVAEVDGVPWHSTVTAVASRSGWGEHDVVFVAGLGESLSISLVFPGSLSAGSTCHLDGTWGGTALCTILRSEGWVAYPTDASHTGSLRITRVDSVSIAGQFSFDGYSPDPHVYRVRSGAFYVPLTSGFAPDLMKSAIQGGSIDGATLSITASNPR